MTVSLATKGVICRSLGGATPPASVNASIGRNVIVVTSAGTGTVSTDCLFIQSMVWDAQGNTGGDLVVRNQFDDSVWSQNSLSSDRNKIEFHPHLKVDGLKVLTMDHGVLYIYLD